MFGALKSLLMRNPAIASWAKRVAPPAVRREIDMMSAEEMGALRDLFYQRPAAQDLAMYRQPVGSDPRYIGAAPDRTTFSYLRYPAKLPPRMARSLTAIKDPKNPARQLLESYVDRGQKSGGLDWYNTEELRDWFQAELGDELGDAEWRGFMYLIGTTSPGSKVLSNIGNASAVRNRLLDDTVVPGRNRTVAEYYADDLLEAENIAAVRAVSKTRLPDYGHLAQGAQELATARFLQGKYSPAPEPGIASAKGSWGVNPKPKGFIQSLLGSQVNMAADLHFVRMMAMSTKDPDWLATGADVGAAFKDEVLSVFPDAKKYFKKRGKGEKKIDVFKAKSAVKDGVIDLDAELPSGGTVGDNPIIWTEAPNATEYAAFEDLVRELAKERGITPAQYQASLWLGASNVTGVAATSQKTFMQLFRDRAANMAEKTGQSPEAVIQKFIRAGGLLSVVGAPTAAVLTGEEKGAL